MKSSNQINYIIEDNGEWREIVWIYITKVYEKRTVFWLSDFWLCFVNFRMTEMYIIPFFLF